MQHESHLPSETPRTPFAQAKLAERVPAVMNGSLVAKLAAQCRAEWMIGMPLGHMAEPAA